MIDVFERILPGELVFLEILIGAVSIGVVFYPAHVFQFAAAGAFQSQGVKAVANRATLHFKHLHASFGGGYSTLVYRLYTFRENIRDEGREEDG
jgi:hypothetical protein